MRALGTGHIDGLPVRPGTLYWTTVEKALVHIADRIAEPANKPLVGPSETPQAGPSETPAVAPESDRGCLRRSKDWPLDRFSRVERVWDGATVVCIATGPSLTEAQVAAVKASGHPTITVNDAYKIAPFADLVYFADAKWWRWQREVKGGPWASFRGAKCTIWTGGNQVDEAEIHILRNARRDGLSENPEEVCTGSNSGYQAINIATLAGAKRVLLLGYDARDIGDRAHYFGDHPDKTKPPYAVIKDRFKTCAAAAKALKVEILNATPGSELDCFSRIELADGLLPYS